MADCTHSAAHGSIGCFASAACAGAAAVSSSRRGTFSTTTGAGSGTSPSEVGAVADAVAGHGHEDTPELRELIRGGLEPEDAYVPGTRTPEPFPG